MDMPTPCPSCGEINELNDMKGIHDNTLVCEDCWCDECEGEGHCCASYCDGGFCECCNATCDVCNGDDKCTECRGAGFVTAD